MGLKISNNLLKKMKEDNAPKLKLSKNLEKEMLTNGFMVAGDLIDEDSQDISNFSFEEVKQYVMEHTVEKSHYDFVSEAGSIIVSFPSFVEMVNDGYEIYEAEVLNEKMISIKYQKEMKRDKKR